MLSRRNARVKVMQVLYSRSQDEVLEKFHLEKNLEKSFIQSEQALYLQMLMIMEVADYAITDTEFRNKKHLRTEEDELASTKLAENSVIQMIREHPYIRGKIQKYKLRHFVDKEMVKHLFQKLRDTNKYKRYIATGKTTDLDIVKYVFTDIMIKDENYNQFVEELFPVWHDDKENIVFAVNALFDGISSNEFRTKLNEFEDKFDEASKFGSEILIKTWDNYDEYKEIISPKLKNWEVERIAIMDLILMQMALTEILNCPTIPVKVTMNEYIDISKKYSTPKSREFINGVLDKIMKELKEEGRIFKSGRGLSDK